MKKTATLILGIIISSSYAQEEHWERLTPVGNDTITNIHFIDEQHGVIVEKLSGGISSNPNRRVHYSNDSGRTWTRAQMDNNPWTVNFGNSWGIESICHSDQNTVWFSGGNRVYKSMDKGRNWELAMTVKESDGVRTSKILFPTPSIGYFFATDFYGDDSTIVGKTTDGGANWSLSQVAGFHAFDAFFLNADTGWIVGYPENDCLRKTVDGGVTWESVNFDAERYGVYIRTVFFPLVK